MLTMFRDLVFHFRAAMAKVWHSSSKLWISQETSLGSILWTLRTWRQRWSERRKALSQMVHGYGLSLVWPRMWTRMCQVVEKSFPQIEQTGSSPFSRFSFCLSESRLLNELPVGDGMSVRHFRDFSTFIGSSFSTACSGIIFTILQTFEYLTRIFNINDSSFASIFF